MISTDQLVVLADAYGRHVGLKRATVSSYAANEGKFLDHLASGGGCTVRRARAVLDWLSANWPDDLAWPADVPRPKLPRPTKGKAEARP